MIRFRKVTENDLEMILRWRTRPEVTRYMNTDIEFDIEKQRRWYEDVVRKKSPAEHWIICQDGRPIGLLSLADYDRGRQQSSWGYYLGEMDSWLLGGLIPPYFYNYMFFQRDPSLKKIIGEAFSLNSRVIQIHRFHGCKEVGTLKDHVRKHGQSYDVTLIEMSRENWLAQQKRFGHYLAEFEG